MTFGLTTALDAVTAVAVLALLSLGLYVTYGLLRVINMAHGEMMTLGAYTVAQLCKAGWPFAIAAAAAAVLVGIFGAVVERTVIRPLHARQDLSTLLATWGVGLVVIEGIRLVFGPSGEFVDAPYGGVVMLGPIPYPVFNAYLVGASILLLVGVAYLLAATPIGIVIRATMENPQLASIRGINVVTVYRWGFAVGAALTGLAGALLAPISAVTPTMGVEYATLAFMVVIVGGLSGGNNGNARREVGMILRGSLVLVPLMAGAALVGGSRSILNALVGITPATLGMLGLVLLALFLRPNGLAGVR